MNSLIDELLTRLYHAIECDGKAIVSGKELALIVDLYNDYISLSKRLTEEHFMLLAYLNREQRASNVLRYGSGNTNDLRKQALEVFGLSRKRNPIQNIFLLGYYANLINGVDPFTGEQGREPLTREDAVKKIAAEGDRTEQAVIKQLQRTLARLKESDQLPEDLEGILPANWPQT